MTLLLTSSASCLVGFDHRGDAIFHSLPPTLSAAMPTAGISKVERMRCCPMASAQL